MFCVNDLETFYPAASALTGRAGSMSAGGMSFLIPLFTKDAVSNAPREKLREWFQLFELYVVEFGYSNGLLIASRHDFSAVVRNFEAQFFSLASSANQV
jgi:hypothetical protein